MTHPKTRLYCLPFAGGSAVVFNPLKRMLFQDIEVVPIEYTGRGKRFREPVYGNMEEAIDDLYSMLRPGMDNVPYALLGYSFGALVIYELIKRIMQEGSKLPIHAFFMACHAPHNRYGDLCFHELSDEKLAEVLAHLGGIPEAVKKNKDLLDIFIPIIKNDFKIYEQYDITQPPVKLPVSYTVLNALKDKLITREKTREWNKYAGHSCVIRFADGDHFFLLDKPGTISSTILDALKPMTMMMT